MNFTAQDLDTLARTIVGEARSEPWAGMLAVGWTVRHRCEDPRRWPDTIHAVCRQRYQFSCWLSSDPNRKVIDKLKPEHDTMFRMCLGAAACVLTGLVEDNTDGANHYLALGSLPKRPAWYDASKVTVTIGHHTFLKL